MFKALGEGRELTIEMQFRVLIFNFNWKRNYKIFKDIWGWLKGRMRL